MFIYMYCVRGQFHLHYKDQTQIFNRIKWLIMCTLGMLDMEMCLDSRRTRMVKLALNAGSSKQGKAARACVASN